MDSIEQKLKAFYQNKKEEDEKLTPAFEVFWDDLKLAKPIKKPYLFLKIAASIAIVITAFLAYFYDSNQRAKETLEISKIDLNQPLPSQILLDESLHTQYIWEWKAPSDKLLEDANKFMNTNINKKF